MRKLGGTMSGYGNDGRLKSAWLGDELGDDLLAVTAEVKKIFDPHNMLNPEVKQPLDKKTLATNLRKDYSLAPFVQYLPGS